MKRVIAILMAASMLFAASACGNNDKNGGEKSTSATGEVISKSCADIYNEDIAGVIKFPNMTSIGENSLSENYGIENFEYSDYVFMTSEDPTLCDTVIIFKATSDESKQEINDKLQTYLDGCKSTTVDYNPEQFAIVEKSSVKSKGDYVYLVFSSDMATIENIIEGAIS